MKSCPAHPDQRRVARHDSATAWNTGRGPAGACAWPCRCWWPQAILVFESEEQQERFKHLTEELRCLVCQNQNLADSDAPLAIDLRNEFTKCCKPAPATRDQELHG